MGTRDRSVFYVIEIDRLIPEYEGKRHENYLKIFEQ